MTIVTGVGNTGSINVFDSQELQAMTSGTLGSHNSTQFEFGDAYFALLGQGTNLGYSNGHPSSGTLTGVEFQLSTGISDWSSFSVSMSSLWSAISSGNVTSFNNLFFSGNDTFNMQASNGQDDLAGGAGNDTFNYAGNLNQFTHIDGGSGTNTLNVNGDIYDPNAFQSVTNIQIVHLGAGHGYTLNMSPISALMVDGSALGANDGAGFHASAGTSAAIAMTGGAGNDWFQGGSGNDTFNAGQGSDTIDLSRATSGLTIDLNQTSVHGPGIGTDTFSSVENAVGTQYNDIFIGNAADNTFYVGLFNGTGGPIGIDSFDGGAGIDTVSFSGYDTGSSTGLTIDLRNGTAGADTFTSIENVIGTESSDTFHGNSADNHFDSGAGLVQDNNPYIEDTIDYSRATGGMTINMTSLVAVGSGYTTSMVASGQGEGTDTLVNFEHIVGSQYDDTFYLLGADLYYTYVVKIDAGAGYDTVSFQNATTGATADAGDLGTSIEHMVGSAFNDGLASYGASDIAIDGGAGDDQLQGGTGNDTLIGGDGNDTIKGGDGSDIINGGEGDDILSGDGTGSDYHSQNDIINGGDGNDELYSGDPYDPNDIGNCIFDGGAGNDSLHGGRGNNTASYADATGGVTVSLNVQGAQNVGGGAGTDTLWNIENLIGSNFNDTLTGSRYSPNTLSGMGGNDTLDISVDQGNYPGNNTALGGSGDDTIIGGSVFLANNTVDGGDGYDTLKLAGDYSKGLTFAATTMVNVETLSLAAGHSYSLTTNNASVAAGQTLTVDGSMLGASDVLTFDGRAEADGSFVILGGAGNDTLNGGAGDDLFNISNGGNDTALGGAGNDIIVMGAALTAADKIDGGTGADKVTLAGNYSAGLTFSATTMVNVETLVLAGGHSYNLTLDDANVAAGQTLTVDASTLGAANPLTFNGSAETDGLFAIKGGAGNETIVMGAMLKASDRIDGGAGANKVLLNGDYSSGFAFSSTTMINVGTLGLAAGHSYDLTTSNATVGAGQTLTIDGSQLGAGDVLTFDGYAEIDGTLVILGGAGNDTLTAGAGNDTISGGAGDDIIAAIHVGDDTIAGGYGNDTIKMGAAFTATDHIDGGPGVDKVWLTADYSAGVAFSATTMVSVDMILLGAGHSYSLTSNDATVAAGLTLTVNGSLLKATDSLIFDGSAETNGKFAFIGGGGNDALTGGAGADKFDLSKGGDDSALSGAGNDSFVLGAALTGADHIDGGAGTDTLSLNGDYSAGLVFTSTTMTNVEAISLASGHSYNLVLSDANVAAGQTLTVNAEALGHSDALVFDGSAEHDGSFIVIGGSGNDILTGGTGRDTLSGGNGDDRLAGGGGADVLTGGQGNNSFIYSSVEESTGPGFDTISHFNVKSDQIGLWFKVTGIDQAVSSGTLTHGNFDADLAAALGLTQLGANHAVLFAPSSGDYVGETFLVVDANGVAGYQAGQDVVIEFNHTAHLDHFTLSDFAVSGVI